MPASPGRWRCCSLTLVDALRRRPPRRGEARRAGHRLCRSDRRGGVTVTLKGGAFPAEAEVAIEADPLHRASRTTGGSRSRSRRAGARRSLPLVMARRGTGRLEHLWLRWRGPLGFAWRQRRIDLDSDDPDPARRPSGPGAWRPGLPAPRAPGPDRPDQPRRRAPISTLSSNIARAWTGGRSTGSSRPATSSSTPRNIGASATTRSSSRSTAGGRCRSRWPGCRGSTGRSRRCSSPAGSRSSSATGSALHAFDSRPRIASGLISGSAAFPELQRLAASIDYSGEETNYTFALTTLGHPPDPALDDRPVHRVHRSDLGRLHGPGRQADGRDPSAARRRASRRGARDDRRRHAAAARRRHPGGDRRRAASATAGSSLTRLQHLGVHVIESEYDRVGERLVAGYIDLKRRNLL